MTTSSPKSRHSHNLHAISLDHKTMSKLLGKNKSIADELAAIGSSVDKYVELLLKVSHSSVLQ